MLLAALLRSFVRTGNILVVDAAGGCHPVGDGDKPDIVVRLTRPTLSCTLALNPKLSIGEAYADGTLVLEQGSIMDFLSVIAQNLNNVGPRHWLNWSNALPWPGHRITIGQARRNVAHHYDLSPAFFDLFLDADRQYSCAYFGGPFDSLEMAQARKKTHIAAKLLLDRPELRVLDIGSGWGGLAMFLAAQAGANVTGVTLSVEQLGHSVIRAEAAGLSEQVEFRLRDYREVQGTYDRIVSVGMFEHVGRRGYRAFFNKMRELLEPDGIALLHSIGETSVPGSINPFIAKYIFPGAEIPSLSEVLRVVERSGLVVTDIEILQLHYAETLRCWRERLIANRDEVIRLFDARLFRMWEFYFALCEVGFRHRGSMVFQIQLARRKDAVPMSRDYMAREAAHRPPLVATAD
jgi:cyclopropane-fatty-acyl-phospholipid synthase